jgi:hypothetical protein
MDQIPPILCGTTGETMTAGRSASVEERRSRLRIAELARRLDEERAQCARWGAAARSEAAVARELQALDTLGWTVLADRRWPGTRTGNVDLLAVGPGGLLVLDVKAWADVRIEDGRLYRGDEDCQDDLDKVVAIAELAEQSAAEVGLAPLEVIPVVVLAGRRGVDAHLGRVRVLGQHDVHAFCVRRGRRLADEQVRAVTTVVERDFPLYDTPPVTASPVVVDPVLPRTEPTDTLFDVEELVAEDLAAALRGPVRSWMTWLHPGQARLVRRSWSGPARITGPAGTGKSVVGLHRAAYLARSRPGRVLWVSFVSTLPTVMRACYAELAPDTLDRVEFTSLHRWASGFLRERGVTARVDRWAAERAFAAAWAEVGEGSVLAGVDVARTYWRDEIDRVVKGRGLTDFGAYRDLDRIGRRTRLTVDHRRVVWDLYESYESRLRAARVHDFNDLLALALAEVHRVPVTGYAAVVVDEVQHLTCVGVRLLHAVAGDGADALVLIGDETQAVYPGGFTLAEAGVAVVGRAVQLRTNYRNAAEILAAADRVGARPAHDDSSVSDVTASDAIVQRSGGRALPYEARTHTEHDSALVSALRRTLASRDVHGGDVAVLAARRAVVNRYLRLLRSAGIPAAPLTDVDPSAEDRVRVGTFKRAKGLEFKYVFLPMLDAGDLPRRAGEGDAAHRERREIAARELYVGMTRARDGLWLGTVTEDERATA